VETTMLVATVKTKPATKLNSEKQNKNERSKTENPKSNHRARASNFGADFDRGGVEGSRRTSHHLQVQLHRKVKVWIGRESWTAVDSF
jgi:hypothetical protein